MAASNSVPPPPPGDTDLDRRVELMLLEQIRERPDDLKPRVRLLEFYSGAHLAQDFLREAKSLRDLLPDPQHSQEWLRIGRLGRQLAPESPLFQAPDATTPQRRFGEDERLQPLFEELVQRVVPVTRVAAFVAELDRELITFNSRPTALQPLPRLSRRNGGARLFLKREDLVADAGALLAAVTGEALLARHLGCKELVTALVHGPKSVVMATLAARLGLAASVFVDRRDTDAGRQTTNLLRIRLCGARVIETDSTRLPRGDVREAAAAHWAQAPQKRFLVMGLEAAPPPYPLLQRCFAAVAGRELRMQLRARTQAMPRLLVARGGHNADVIQLFPPFLDQPAVELVCVNPRTLSLQTARGDSTGDAFEAPAVEMGSSQHRVAEAILGGLEYPGVEREHAWLTASGRVRYVETAAVEPVREAITAIASSEGLVPALQTAQALAWTLQAARGLPNDAVAVLGWCERVDKDIWDLSRIPGIG
ncbi:MAG: pyridoxal-phosphate dependent enzyme [Gammaproteobacteria bacterium]|nr:pyridoxal-phosphate dependent enzyme [Gammaproteobacteria bacterium]